MGPKYEFTNEIRRYNGRLLHRIRRIEDGKLGGWIEFEANLSQEGNCWVDEEAKVFDDARVCDNAYVHWGAQVRDNAQVSGNAEVRGVAQVRDNAQVSGNAVVYGEAKICGGAEVSGHAVVYDEAEVNGGAKVYDNAQVYMDVSVYGKAKIYGEAVVSCSKVFDNAEIYGNVCASAYAVVYGEAKIYGNAHITDNATVHGNAEVYDNATIYGDVCGNAKVYGNARVWHEATVHGNAEVCGEVCGEVCDKIIDEDTSNNEQSTAVVQDFIYKIDDSDKFNVKTEYNSIDEYFSNTYQNDIKLDTLIIGTVDTKISLIKIEKVEIESKTEFKFIVDITNEKGSNFSFKSVIQDAEQLNSLVTQTIEALNAYPEFAKYTNDLADCL